MNNHIDITFDMETTALTANAAVMQLAAVVWDRSAMDDPFMPGGTPRGTETVFNRHVDLRSCVVDGFDFDQEVIGWWSRQSAAAKEAVTDDLAEPIGEVFRDFSEWIQRVKDDMKAGSVCLWCQGTDFDGAILRNVCRHYSINLPVDYRQLRDCRTVSVETAAMTTSVSVLDHDGYRLAPEHVIANPSLAYEFYKPLPEKYAAGRVAHDAVYDCLRSSWNVWQALRWLDGGHK